MSHLRLWPAAAGLVVAVIMGVALGVGTLRYFSARAAAPMPATAVVRQIQTLSQLVTVRYVIEKVVVLEDVKWFGESRVLMVAHGVVNAGVDLEEITPEDLELDGDRVRLRLPRARVFDVYLDESKTRVIERTTGLLRTFDKQMETTARQNAVSDLRAAARHAGILADAEERARVQIELLFRRLGFEHVEILAP